MIQLLHIQTAKGEYGIVEDMQQSVGHNVTQRLKSRVLKVASVTAFLCGFVGLGVEIVGFRILVFFVEGFTATFAAMLAVFIGGLGVGSLLLGPWLTRLKRPDLARGLLLLATGAILFLELWVVVPGLEELVVGLFQQ